MFVRVNRIILSRAILSIAPVSVGRHNSMRVDEERKD